ncbi:MAG: hypothetical protein JWM88_2154 [Verrucomicrobia bacterium]|nr:hypothetical protein [Verrucomicrobiota bacterium]
MRIVAGMVTEAANGAGSGTARRLFPLLLGIFGAVSGRSDVLPARSSYLLLDDRVVDRAEHVQLKVGSVAKHPANPLFKEDRPWEVRFDNVYPNLAYDAQTRRYVCWYSPFIVDELTAATPKEKRAGVPYHSTPTREMALCYATSADGIHWEKPDLGVVEFDGGRKNNLVLRASHGAGVLWDRAEKDPARRYKVFGGRQIPGQKRRFQVAFSLDGIHWSDPVLCPEIGVEGDTHNNAIWAPALGKYVGITRRWLAGQRLVMRSESTDFTHWTPAQEIMRGDEENQTYAMPIFSYRDLYLGLVMVISLKTDRVSCELAWSPDTVSWRRVDAGHALIPNSNVPGDYDWGCVYAGTGPVTEGDEIRLYYGASNGPHTAWRDSFLALATLRTDRFAGYAAGENAGVIITQPIALTGNQLVLNLEAPQGEVGVEVLDSDLAPVDGFSGERAAVVSGIDGIATPVAWRGGAGLGSLGHGAVRFKFTLQRAKLYSFGLR